MGSFPSKSSHSDHITWAEPLDSPTESLIAGLEQRLPLSNPKVIWCPIASAGFNEKQRAVVDHKKTGEELLRCNKCFLSPTPQSSAAHFTFCTCKALNRPFGVHCSGSANGSLNAQPFLNRCYLTKRDAGLRHSPRSRIHPEEDNLLRAVCIEFKISIVRFSGVFKRIVNVGDRGPEA